MSIVGLTNIPKINNLSVYTGANNKIYGFTGNESIFSYNRFAEGHEGDAFKNIAHGIKEFDPLNFIKGLLNVDPEYLRC